MSQAIAATAPLGPAAPAAAPARRPAGWLFNPTFDLIVGCGGWTIPLMLLAGSLSATNMAGVAVAFYALSLFCNYPHYMATLYRAYGTREDFSKYRFFTVYLTAAVLLTLAIAHFAIGLLPWILTLYILWSPWHYTGQNFGLTMMFVRRNGAQPSRLDRNILYYAFVASYTMWLIGMLAGYTGDPYVLSPGFDPAVVTPMRWALFGVVIVLGAWAIVRLVRSSGLRPMIAPLTLLGTHFIWFVLPFLFEVALDRRLGAVYYSTGILAFMHCAQYLWVTSYYARRETEAGVRGKGRWNPLAYYAILVVGGMALFVPGPWLVSYLFHYDPTASFLIFVSIINIHHFAVDGAIWKLRDGRIAQLLLGKRGEGSAAGRAVENALGGLGGWVMGRSPLARGLRWTAVGGLLGVAVLDQAVFYLTSAPGRAEIVARLNPWDPRAHLDRATALSDEGRHDEAIAELHRALRINSHNGPALRMLGQLLVEKGDVRAAYDHYKLVESRVHPDLATLSNVGVLATHHGDYALAERRLREALRTEPTNRGNHHALAEAYMAQGKFADAVREYKYFINTSDESEPSDPVKRRRYLAAVLKSGEANIALGDFKEAAMLLEVGADLAEKLGEVDIASKAAVLLAGLMVRDGKVDEALSLHQWAIATVTGGGSSGDQGLQWYNYGRFLEDQGMPAHHALAAYMAAEVRLGRSAETAMFDAARNRRAAMEARVGAEAAADLRVDLEAAVIAAVTYNPAGGAGGAIEALAASVGTAVGE